ncbi:MAG: hypothetical protein E7671_01340 [Ruminococcaceae bacterium]|nr:hypothetical protein [Oscillospiraceae bacterium]
MIKIFHFADLHLDSPFAGGDIKRSEEGRKRLRDVFLRMMRHVRETGYDIVLIPGDLFEDGYVTNETANMLRSELASLECPVFISPGNHDPYHRASPYACISFTDNVHVFSSESVEKVDIGKLGVSVYGYAFTDSLYRSSPLAGVATEPDKINLLCAHTEINTPLTPYAPMSFSDIESAGFTYAALGHVHKAPDHFTTDGCACAYSGFGEGRAFDEIGKGGALSVTIFETGEKAKISIEKLSFSSYSFEILPITLMGARSDAEVADIIENTLPGTGFGKNTALRIVLEGVTDGDYRPNVTELRKRFANALDYLEIKDKTSPEGSYALLRKDSTLKGEFYRALEDKLTSGDERERAVAVTALRIGIAALEGRDISVFLPYENENEGEA